MYLSDFGLSKGSLSSAGVTSSGQFLGTPNYTAPEQIQGRPVGGQTDQYALACTAFELLCGEPVFPRDQGVAIIYAHLSQPPRSLLTQRPDLLPAADAVLARALAKAPQDRFGSCQEFAEALRASLSVAPAVATPLAAQAPSWPGAGTTAQLAARHRDMETAPRPHFPDRSSVAPRLAAWGTVPPSRPPAPWQDTARAPTRPVNRRKLLWVAAAIPVAAVAGAVGWEASRRGEAATTAQKPTARATPTHDPDPRWQAHVPFGHGAVLAAAGGLVIVAGGLEGPRGNQVRALDAASGRPAWRHTGSGVIDQVAATDQAVYLATEPVSAVRASDGSELWTSPHTALYGPVEADGTVYVAEGTLYALRARDGGLRWQYPADVTSHPVVAGGMLYTLGVRGGSRRTVLHAIRTADGAHQWDTPAPPGGVLATDGQVVCAVEGEEVGEPGRALGLAGQRRPAAVARAQGHRLRRPGHVGRGALRGARRRDADRLPRSQRDAAVDRPVRPSGSPPRSARAWSTPATTSAAWPPGGPPTARSPGPCRTALPRVRWWPARPLSSPTEEPCSGYRSRPLP